MIMVILNMTIYESFVVEPVSIYFSLLASNANPNATCRLSHVSACHIAALNSGNALKILLSYGANKQRTNKLGQLPLHFAAWAGNIQNIAALLNLPKNMDVSNNFEECLRKYSRGEIKVMMSNENMLTAVNAVCEIGSESVLPMTWSDSMDHNCVQNKEKWPPLQPGWTALHAACATANLRCVRFLLTLGAKPTITDFHGRSPLDVVGLGFHFGLEMNVNDFMKIIDLLRVYGAKFMPHTINNERNIRSCHNNKNSHDDQASNATKLTSPDLYDTPLHIAVLLESVDAIKHLLDAGASFHVLNGEGKTPMHVCVKKQLKEHLQLLANYGYDNADPFIATVDVKDSDGCTVLHAAIKECWIQGVCVALASGACITMKDKKGESPLHAAAAGGNKMILQEIAMVAKENFVINHRDIHSRTPLFLAIMHNDLDNVKILLEHGASKTMLLSNNVNAIQVAAKVGNVHILDFLLNNQNIYEDGIINSATNAGIAPIHYAVNQNNLKCVKLLLSKRAKLYFPVDDTSDDNKLITPLHIAAARNHLEIAQYIVHFDEKTIRQKWDGYLPLHDACRYGNRDIVALLLKKGCDLSSYTECKNVKATAISMIMDNISKPTEFLERVFDSYISCNGLDPQNINYEVVVDFKVLNPDPEGPMQINVIKALLETGNRYDQKRLLMHPLVESFLCWKWRTLMPFFYVMLSLYGCFVMALNIYVISVFYFDDKGTILPMFWNHAVWKYILYVTVMLVLVQEIIYTRVKSKSYFFWLEMLVKIGAIGLSMVLPFVLYPPDDDVKENSIATNHTIITNSSRLSEGQYTTSSVPEESRLLATIAVLLSWLELTFLLARMPSLGFYVLMFGKVATQVVKILLTFIFFIFGFAISFMIHFHLKKPFEGPWASLVKTIVMMSSEFDYNDIIDNEEDELAASIILNRIIFVVFLVLTSIVLMNLMVGVAVNDLYNLKLIGNMKRIEAQVEFLSSLESIVYHNTLREIFPKAWTRFIERNKVGAHIVLRPSRLKCKHSKYLQPRVMQAIFEKAQMRKNNLEEERSTETDKIKLQEIHEVLTYHGNLSDDGMNGSKNNVNNIKVIYEMMRKLNTTVKKLSDDVGMIKLSIAHYKRANDLNIV